MGSICSHQYECKKDLGRHTDNRSSHENRKLFKRFSSRYGSCKTLLSKNVEVATSLEDSESELLRYEREFSPTSVYFTEDEKKLLEHMYPQSTSVKKFGHLKYKKYREIAQGTAGVVWQAFDLVKGTIIAVKTIYSDKEKIETFQREADIFAQLNHKNIVKFLGSRTFRRENRLEIYMEYIDGLTLKQMLYQHLQLGEEVTACYTMQILNAIEYIHSKDIIHRDIKSLNVLVSKKGVVKLTDFGSYIHLSEKKTPSVGTVFWMAPEVLASSQYERWADIWSLGCVVYEMLVGESPFKEDTVQLAALRIAAFEDQLDFPEHISECARHFIRCCLKKNPQQRRSASRLKLHPFIRSQDLSSRLNSSGSESSAEEVIAHNEVVNISPKAAIGDEVDLLSIEKDEHSVADAKEVRLHLNLKRSHDCVKSPCSDYIPTQCNMSANRDSAINPHCSGGEEKSRNSKFPFFTNKSTRSKNGPNSSGEIKPEANKFTWASP